MKVKDALKRFQTTLEEAGIATARLDCLVLLEDILNTNRTQLLASPERELTEVEATTLTELIQKRVLHVPLAYLREKTEFYGREFYVNADVLEPRPESETMIEVLKKIQLSAGPRIADIGTGSGALGVTAALEIPGAQVDLIDIDPRALSVAERNAKQHHVVARCMQSDLLADTTVVYDVLLCNLPYVPDDFHINRAAAHEPAIAIFGGPDGLDLYRTLFKQLAGQRIRPQHVLTESLPTQHEALRKIAAQGGYRLIATEDFIQHFARVEQA